MEIFRNRDGFYQVSAATAIEDLAKFYSYVFPDKKIRVCIDRGFIDDGRIIIFTIRAGEFRHKYVKMNFGNDPDIKEMPISGLRLGLTSVRQNLTLGTIDLICKSRSWEVA